MRLPFCILNVRGDVLDDGELHFVEAAQASTLQKHVSRRSRSCGRASMLFMTRQRESECLLPQAQPIERGSNVSAPDAAD
jgi:hypothetical protein